MENKADGSQSGKTESGFKMFAAKRIIIAAVIIIVVVWGLGVGLDIVSHPNKPAAEVQTPLSVPEKEISEQSASQPEATNEDTSVATEPTNGNESPVAATEPAKGNESPVAVEAESSQADNGPHAGDNSDSAGSQTDTAAAEMHPEDNQAEAAAEAEHAPAAPPTAETKPQEQPAESHASVAEPPAEPAVRPRGVAFVEALIEPMDYELNKRFWGWRPNDIINFTDNTNNFQLGVLEVTRRSAIMLSDRISRTGSTDRLNPHLEDAANWLMVTATRYWFPSPESKYKECIKELEAYKQELIKGSASFYIRADNLIPLLSSYEDLLGSCDENLVKQKNEDGSNVSFFQADDYFFYAKGVASALATILEAIHDDFLATLENRHGTELLHHALLSCRQASDISPLLIIDADLDGLLANHRANMAAPISHARYYIGQLIKTLST